MILDTGTLIGLIIALAGSITVMGLLWKQNIILQRETQDLLELLRKEKNNG
jgi:hypothetical protein